jgi:pimeloyl-ACP methyl ester carboxylesterase
MRRDAGAGTNLSRSRRHDPESMSFIHWFKDDEASWPGTVFLSPEELDYFAGAYARRGFGGGLNWYRSIVANWREQSAMFPGGRPPKITVPSLMICARNDYVCDLSLSDGLLMFVETAERRIIEDCGHWTQQEQPEETNRIMVEWLTRWF